jgi:hypothetical protein
MKDEEHRAMDLRHPASRRAFTLLALPVAAGILTVGSEAEAQQSSTAGRRPDGRVEMEFVQAGYVGSGGGGSGTLRFGGRTYRFTVASGGIGGVGASTVTATGDVYNLRNVSRFPGAYAQVRTGVTVGRGRGELWLRNPSGVTMHLRTQRRGLMLSMGGDAVVITMDD